MIKIQHLFLPLLIIIMSFKPAPVQQLQAPVNDFCGIKNNSFSAGEKILMKVYYSTMGAYIGAGEATFTT